MDPLPTHGSCMRVRVRVRVGVRVRVRVFRARVRVWVRLRNNLGPFLVQTPSTHCPPTAAA